jgi:hypothetical protein
MKFTPLWPHPITPQEAERVWKSQARPSPERGNRPDTGRAPQFISRRWQVEKTGVANDREIH